MGLFKKRKPTIPKLPESPELPEMDSLKSRFSGKLSESPKAKKVENVSYRNVKPREKQFDYNQAITQQPRELQQTQQYPQTAEQQDFPELRMQGQPAISPQSYEEEFEEEPQEFKSQQMTTTPREKVLKEQIFVKVEKIKEVLSTLDEINKKINYLDATLDKIKEIKNKEQEELERWEKEILDLKTKIIEIDSKLFKS